MLQLVKDHQQQVKSLPELSQLQPQLLRKMGEKFKLSNEKVEAFMDKRLKNHLNSLSNGRRAQTQALDKQLKGVEELVVESQERCSKALVELREVLEIGGVARATDPQQETLVRVTCECILVTFLALLLYLSANLINFYGHKLQGSTSILTRAIHSFVDSYCTVF